MTLTTVQLAPTGLLPPLRGLHDISEDVIFAALNSLRLIYCPIVPPAAAFQRRPSKSHLPPPQVDSGYVSGDDEESCWGDDHGQGALATLRADAFERDFAFRWLTSLILRADELQLGSDDAREQLVEDASGLLASLTVATASGVSEEAPEEDQDCGITREFTFDVTATSECPGSHPPPVTVRLFDADLAASDHTGVGLQSWGASIIFSELVCKDPARLGLTRAAPRSCSSPTRVVELGAGTGLVSLVLAQLLPRVGVANAEIVATDYHPDVLDNLRANIAANEQACGVQVAPLDWSDPVLAPPLDAPADVLVATDVVYAPEHARWLRDCASRLLSREGVFWLLATVRPAGKFEGISDTVEDAFGVVDDTSAGDGLRILETAMLDKRRGVGRGDEVGYRLFKIGWASW
ncbi:hypothetical protein PpBr36_02745 [Pyricularia pennisetigena]|uniref:hypothetical protein n=1 Tax=Pyricularia pennisetigena TaxID=1578925 RepID=UPI00115270D2|nr:hypothetical protein PpBr36_02745 [Pyricularia pennisetigena]TLS31574.1 hypothetical protein PpBr36_02745 [Pyricularia pennisetigena]